MSDLLEHGRRVLADQAFSRLLQAELVALSPGRAVLRVPVTPDTLQQHGFAHGGLVSYLADNALTFAAGSVLGDCVTSEYKINYLRPAVGETLEASATVEMAGRKQAVVRCTVTVSGTTEKSDVAIAQGTIVKIDKP